MAIEVRRAQANDGDFLAWVMLAASRGIFRSVSGTFRSERTKRGASKTCGSPRPNRVRCATMNPSGSLTVMGNLRPPSAVSSFEPAVGRP